MDILYSMFDPENPGEYIEELRESKEGPLYFLDDDDFRFPTDTTNLESLGIKLWQLGLTELYRGNLTDARSYLSSAGLLHTVVSQTQYVRKESSLPTTAPHEAVYEAEYYGLNVTSLGADARVETYVTDYLKSLCLDHRKWKDYFSPYYYQTAVLVGLTTNTPELSVDLLGEIQALEVDEDGRPEDPVHDNDALDALATLIDGFDLDDESLIEEGLQAYADARAPYYGDGGTVQQHTDIGTSTFIYTARRSGYDPRVESPFVPDAIYTLPINPSTVELTETAAAVWENLQTDSPDLPFGQTP